MRDDALRATIIIYGAVAFASLAYLLTGCKSAKPKDGPWRTDMATIQASKGVVEFETRGVISMSGKNKDGGCEWIIARIEGQGFDRLLIMTMCGNRATRIYFQSGGKATEINGRFPRDLPNAAKWRVEANGGTLRVYLDGKEIWSQAGKYTVWRAVMGGYPNRQMQGEWR